MNKIKAFFRKTAHFFVSLGRYGMRHKIQAGIAILILAGIGYWGYTAYAKAHTPAQYVLSEAAVGPLQVVVSGTGQVAASHQLDLSPKASGTITYVGVKAGQQVTAGTIVAEVDPTDAQKQVRDAQTNLESARISLETAKTNSANSIANSATSVNKARDAGFDTVASTYSDLAVSLQALTTFTTGTSDVTGDQSEDYLSAYSDLIRKNTPEVDTARDTARASVHAAQAAYQQSFAAYQTATRTASPQDIQTLLESTQRTVTAVNQANKDVDAFLNLVGVSISVHNTITAPASLATNTTNFNTNTSRTSADASSIANALSSLITAEQTAAQNTQSLDNSSTPLDVQSAELSYEKATNALQDAQDTLENYIVRAPFAGTIAQVSVQKYDQAGASTKVATLITTQQYADLSLNEVDASKVQAGQKATMTFDAIDGLTMSGTVAEVDRVGTVSQGVVNYDVKIGFDTQDPRILPGMTVNATIVVASKDNALQVPSAAVKTQGNFSYVQVVTGAPAEAAPNASSTRPLSQRTGSSTFNGQFGSSTRMFTGAATGTRTQTVNANQVTIKRVRVTIGLVNDTMTEIVSGLNPGDKVVTQTLNASGKSTTAPSLFSAVGGRAPGAGGARTTGGSGARAGGG